MPTPSSDLAAPSALPDIDRQLPAGNEVFLDHLAHFVHDAEAARSAFARCGFAPTPVSIQVSPNPAGGTSPTGTGNVTAMFSRGYIEVLFKTSDTPLSREFDAALARRAGLHLAAFAVADAEAAHRRLAADGFAVRPLVHMSRPVETESGPGIAAFTIARVEPGVMPEGRIQMLTHHTEEAVWQKRWLTHPNSAIGLIDVVIAVADVEEAAQRFVRFTGGAITRTPGGALLRLDRGGVYLVSHDRATEKLPEVQFATLPFIVGYALRVQSLGTAEAAIDRADLEWRAIEDGIVATFPAELGEGAWFFVEKRRGAAVAALIIYSAGTFSASAGYDFLHRAAPAVVRQVEDDAVRVLVFDLVEGVRIVVGLAGEIGGAGVGRLLGGLVEIVDPHAEMHEAMIALVEARNVALVFQQRHVDGAVGHIAADAGLADALHAESFLEELCGLVGIGNRQRNVTKPCSHGSLPVSNWAEFGEVLAASILRQPIGVKHRERRYCG